MSSYIPIASQTLGSSASSVTFSSIPTTLNGKTLRDLVLVYRGAGSTFSYAGLRFNGSASTYALVTAWGNGSSATSEATTSLDFGAFHRGGGAQYPSTALVNIFDYTQTNKHKSYLSRWGNMDYGITEMLAGRWGFTNAVTSLTVLVSSGNFLSGSVFSLYGIEG